MARLHTLPHAFYRVEVLFHCGKVLSPAEAGAFQTFEVIPRLRHQLFLHVAFRADKEDIAVRVAFPHHIGNRDGRVDVSRRAAAGKNHRMGALFYLVPLRAESIRPATGPAPPDAWTARRAGAPFWGAQGPRRRNYLYFRLSATAISSQRLLYSFSAWPLTQW